MTDIFDNVLVILKTLIKCDTINILSNPDALDPYKKNKGKVHVMFETSGDEVAIRLGMEVLKPKAIMIQLGLGRDVLIPQNIIVKKELELRGSFRLNEEFGQAVKLINSKQLKLNRLLTHNFSIKNAFEAFEVAGNKKISMKVQIDF